MRFSDRIDPNSFTDDEVVGIAAAGRDIPSEDVPESDWAFLPERLFERLIHLGHAYSLHFASLVDPQAESQLNSSQCEGFLEELHFLDQVVNEPSFSSLLKSLIPKVQHVVRCTGTSLRFSPP